LWFAIYNLQKTLIFVMARAIIQTQEVEVTYNPGKSNEFKALRNMNVEIMSREYIIFFGPSGCGKSTLLYSIFGVLPPSDGKVFVKGDRIYNYGPMELVEFQRHTMGIMYQQFNLIPSLTVLDNVALPLIFAGLQKSRRERRAMELLDRFAIAHVANKLPTNLSGGQQQRVSVARSLVTDPEILIADEPVGNLDSISAEAVMNTLDQINEHDRKTILLVTHDAKHLPYAHRVFYLKEGRMDRIVPNPEKKQVMTLRPGTSIITELEQVQRIYPYDSPEAIRVKSIINYITQDMSFEQLVRLEKIAEYVIKGKLDIKVFEELLVKGQKDGGVGLRAEYAREVAKKLERVLVQSQDIVRFRNSVKQKDATDMNQQDLADRLACHLILEHNIELSPGQFKNLKQSVDVRVSAYIDKAEFKRQLMLQVDQGGVGIDMYVAHDIARHLEKLIAQGVAEVKVQEKREHDVMIMKAEQELAAKKATEEANAAKEKKGFLGRFKKKKKKA